MEAIYDKVALMLTYRCNARCDICCLSCSPDNEAHLQPELAERVIREAGALPEYKWILISGGEAWLYREEVLSYIRLAHSLGLRTQLFTNGFWGRTDEEARRCVAEMKEAGLDAMRFSGDKYHQQYIPAAHLRQAVWAALEVGLQCDLSVMGFTDVDAQSWKLENLGEDLLHSELKVLDYFAIPAGRAREKLSDESFVRFFHPAVMPKCSIAGVVQLTPAGEWYSCCGITSMELPQLKLGRAEEIPLAEVESRVLARDFLRIIFLEGWAWIYLKASQLGQPFPQRVTMNCECCSFLFAHPELMAAMAEEAHNHAASLKPRKVQAGGVFQRALKGAAHGN